MFCVKNVQAVKSKTADIRNYICSNYIGNHRRSLKLGCKIKILRRNLRLFHRKLIRFFNKIGRVVVGEGLGCYSRKILMLKNIDSGERSSFEFSEWRVIFVIVYRPPYSRTFFEEFSSYWNQLFCPRSHFY